MLAPLGRKLHAEVGHQHYHGSMLKVNTMQSADVTGFVEYLKNITHGETLLVAWEHHFIPRLIKAIDPRRVAPARLFLTCNTSDWVGPDEEKDISCFDDVMWQLMLYREDRNSDWHVRAFSQMHMGFSGLRNSSCNSAFSIYSDPVNWAKIQLQGVSPVPEKVNFFRLNSDSNALLSIPFAIQLLVLLVQLRLCGRKSTKVRGDLEQSLLSDADSLEAKEASSSHRSTKMAVIVALAIVLTAAVGLVLWSNVSVASWIAVLAFLHDFLAGGVAGAITTTITYPIQRVKQLLQTQDRIPAIASGEVPRYAGIADCFKRVYREEGLPAFWRGNLANVLRYFPVAAFSFAFLGSIQSCFPKYDPDTQFLQLLLVNVVSGGIAGACSLTLVYPLDYANTRLASDIGTAKSTTLPLTGEKSNEQEFSGILDCLYKTFATKGVLSVYTGYTVSVVGIVVYRAPYFGLFDTINALNPYQDVSMAASIKDYLLGLLMSFLVAQITAAFASFLSYPFDTVRRRLQMEANRTLAERQYKNGLHCAHVIAKTEGIQGFYKGFLANLYLGAGGALVLILFQQIDGSH
jgi:solute carrier family 25 (adenine nucleotide translocator) protein 4/5/6/31